MPAFISTHANLHLNTYHYPTSPSTDSISILCTVFVCLHVWLHSVFLFMYIPFFPSWFYFIHFLKCYLLKVRVQLAMFFFLGHMMGIT